MDVGKAIDKYLGANRDEIGFREHSTLKDWSLTQPISDEAKRWDGWGTALKPATEFWTLVRKPLSENTISENVLKYHTGGLNIDISRIEFNSEKDAKSAIWGRTKVSKVLEELAIIIQPLSQ